MTRSTSSLIVSSTTTSPIVTSQSSLMPNTTSVLTTTTLKEENLTRTSEDSYKLSTFQTVEKHTTSLLNVTAKPTKTTVTTIKPPSYTTKPRPKPSSTPKPASTTTKPFKLTRPTTPTTTRTTKPVKLITKPIITKKPIIVSSSTIKLTKPSTSATTTKPPATSTSAKTPSAVTTTEKAVIPILVKLNTTSTVEPNEVPVVGNPATNEIEQVKPLQPPPTVEQTTSATLITWSTISEETTKPSNISQGWKPLTTPDGWVLIPSLSTLTPTASSVTVNYTLESSTMPVQTSTLSSSSQMSSIGESANVTSSSAITTETLSTTLPLLPVQVPQTTGGVNMSDFTDVCGRRMYPEARIVGGERSTFGKWPWQISLRQWRTSTYLHKCGAALLNENWAITAAHCVDNVPPSDLLLRLGEHDLSTDSEPYIHQERRVQIVAAHPQFDPRTFEYDLALLRFYEPVQFQPNIIPVCVPNTDENFVGRTAYVTGWGRLYEDGPLPSVLQQVAVPVINNTVCESMYRSAGYIEHIPHIFICAGWRKGGFDSCEGDSGGPMVIQREDKRFLLAGVISWGIGCAEPNQPGVYTRISEFRDWINQILQF
ncbi:serine proteinase stubble isoform X2 [Photinus pyralis]|nr:serine proteinase stubble isoform X2 [Photinus pyralis]